VAKTKVTMAKGTKAASSKSMTRRFRSAKDAKTTAGSALTQRPVTKRANVSSAQAESAVRAYLSHKHQ
jgi:hypothetical protein